MKKSEAGKVYKLLKRWTRYAIMERFGRFSNLEYVEYAVKRMNAEKKIRELLYGTSDLFVLGKEWGILHEDGKIRGDLEKRKR